MRMLIALAILLAPATAWACPECSGMSPTAMIIYFALAAALPSTTIGGAVILVKWRAWDFRPLAPAIAHWLIAAAGLVLGGFVTELLPGGWDLGASLAFSTAFVLQIAHLLWLYTNRPAPAAEEELPVLDS